MFAEHMKWDDDYTLEKDNGSRRGLLQLAMYAQHLGTGNSLHCKSIKAATIQQYIQSVASFLALFGEHPRDYRKEISTDTRLSQVLTSVFDEIKRWESVPNRREPFTLEMLADMTAHSAVAGCGEDSLQVALADWFECGLFAGLRLSEWAQEAQHSSMEAYKRNFKKQAGAFCLGDIGFESNTRARYSAVEAVSPTCAGIQMTRCWITFRTQKNGKNGEKRLFTFNPRGGKCFVSAMLPIVQRFIRICGAGDVTTPLALYKNGSGHQPRFITSVDIEKAMREVASRVYNLDPKKDKAALQLWSAHSLRVGACVILHAMGFTETQIKWLLRWSSDAFMVYLRNTAILADRHHQTLDKAAAMPHFI